MATKAETDNEAKVQLWNQLDKGFAAMLWVKGSDQHPQPMTLFADKANGVVWFITSSQTDLANAVIAAGTTGVDAAMTFVSSSEDFYASLEGQLEIVSDNSKLDELWSVGVAAWFEHGRDDPTVRLMRFTPKEAALWTSEKNSVLVGLKLLRAGMTDGRADPDIGMHRVVAFDRAA